MQPVAEAGALDSPGSTAAVAGLHSCHPEHSPQDGGPARVPSCLQPALRPVRECSTSRALGRPPQCPQSGQARRACTGDRKPPWVPSRASSQSQGRSGVCSLCLKAKVLDISQSTSREPGRPRSSSQRFWARAATSHLAFPAEGPSREWFSRVCCNLVPEVLGARFIRTHDC